MQSSGIQTTLNKKKESAKTWVTDDDREIALKVENGRFVGRL